MDSKRIFLTFDLEEWPLNCGYCHQRLKKKENFVFSTEGCLRLMELLGRYGIKSTFFVTGLFARNKPELIKMLAAQGHEIASHGLQNQALSGLPLKRLLSQIKLSVRILNDLCGQKVIGFRAPYCYFDLELLKMLSEAGLLYDSSLHPAVVPGRYCNIRYPLDPFSLNFGKGRFLTEFPISVIPLLRFPISWWWMRNCGYRLTRWGCRINLRVDRNVLLYFHPWEFADLPEIKGIPKHLTRNGGRLLLKRLERMIIEFKDVNEFLPVRTELPSLESMQNENSVYLSAAYA